MQRPDGPETKRSAAVPLLLAFMVLSAAIALLSFLTLGFAGAILAMALALSAFVCFQYLLWGWWLGPLIRQSEAERERLKNSESNPPQV